MREENAALRATLKIREAERLGAERDCQAVILDMARVVKNYMEIERQLRRFGWVSERFNPEPVYAVEILVSVYELYAIREDAGRQVALAAHVAEKVVDKIRRFRGPDPRRGTSCPL